MTGKKIVLCISGSIAAYKAPMLVRLLVKAGAEVKVVMTPAATDFVSPLALGTVSRNPVLVELFKEETWANHVQLGRWADVLLVAPLSCNTLSKMAAGACDNLLLATYLSATCPVVVAPAMDEDMWHHPATRRNLDTLRKDGVTVIPVEHGELASGLIGDGRMAEPERIVAFLNDFFTGQNSLKGRHAVVTAGPTYEAIDPVRFIGNHSSGKMGWAVAAELAKRGADVTLVSGPVALSQPPKGVRLVPVTTAGEMYRACTGAAYDIAVMAAAVADYAPAEVADQKIKKKGESLTLRLQRTPDILGSLGKEKKPGQVLVGFALETENEQENALQKLRAKNADMLVLNSLRDEGAGFGHDTNKASFFFSDGREQTFPLKSKTELAKDIVDALTTLLK